VKVGNFEKYIRDFASNSSFEVTSHIDYPARGPVRAGNGAIETGINLLDLDLVQVPRKSVSLHATLPPGCGLRIAIENIDGPTPYSSRVSADEQNDWSRWIECDDIECEYDVASPDMEFWMEPDDPVRSPDVTIYLEKTEPGKFLIDYFENGDTEPTHSKILHVGTFSDAGV
jgi:hypothetical protein